MYACFFCVQFLFQAVRSNCNLNMYFVLAVVFVCTAFACIACNCEKNYYKCKTAKRSLLLSFFSTSNQQNNVVISNYKRLKDKHDSFFAFFLAFSTFDSYCDDRRKVKLKLTYVSTSSAATFSLLLPF